MNKRENIYSLKGFGKVFRFTLSQTFKNKGYLVAFVMFVLVMTFMGPIQYLSQHTSQSAAEDSLSYDPAKVEVDKICIYNVTTVGLQVDDLTDLYMTDEEAKEEENRAGVSKDKVQVLEPVEEIDYENKLADSLGDKDVIVFIKLAA